MVAITAITLWTAGALAADRNAEAAPDEATAGPIGAPSAPDGAGAASSALQLEAPPPDEEPPPLDPMARISDLEARVEQLQSVVTGRQPRLTVGGYIDIGLFVPQGDGSGIIRDEGNARFPEYQGRYGWVFLGDLLAPTINSRGEAADLGSPTGAPVRFDSVHSRGAPGLIANEVNLAMTLGLGPSALGTASVNFAPRSGSNFNLGDFFDVDIAQLEWMPTRSQRTSFFVGKVDSVLGIEYRDRKASQRFGITPSLIARYTTGTALGLKLRSKIGPDDLLVVAAAVTNGSFTTEQFHFYNEIDTNVGKTASGRVSLHPPLPFELEIGASGSYGAQDRSPNDRGAMWFWGGDLQLRVKTLELKAQYLRGAAPGDPLNEVYGLKLHGGGYAEIDWMITPLVGLLARGEYRDAFVWLDDPTADAGANRAYLTKSWRGTGGLRLAFSDRVVLKAEYLRNGEYGGIPAIKNDVFTMSLLLLN